MDSDDEHFSKIIEDLKILFSKDEIKGTEFEIFLDELQTDEVKNYVKNIARGSKPEVALRETFFMEESGI